MLKPNIVYSGQKLIRLVATNTPPNTRSTIPKVPVTVPVKYKAANTNAMTILATLSIVPMFFFMTLLFEVNERFH